MLDDLLVVSRSVAAANPARTIAVEIQHDWVVSRLSRGHPPLLWQCASRRSRSRGPG